MAVPAAAHPGAMNRRLIHTESGSARRAPSASGGLRFRGGRPRIRAEGSSAHSSPPYDTDSSTSPDPALTLEPIGSNRVGNAPDLDFPELFQVVKCAALPGVCRGSSSPPVIPSDRLGRLFGHGRGSPPHPLPPFVCAWCVRVPSIIPRFPTLVPSQARFLLSHTPPSSSPSMTSSVK